MPAESAAEIPLQSTPRSPTLPRSSADLPGLVLRAPELGDCEAITEMSNLPGFRHGTLRLPFQSVAETRRWHEQRPPGDVSIVAVLDGKLVGQAGLHRASGRRAHAAGIGMGVHDAYVGRGIGRAMMAGLVDTADNWLGILRLELTVYTDNAPALALYRSFGFEIEGTRRADVLRAGCYVDAYEMARLSPALLLLAGRSVPRP